MTQTRKFDDEYIGSDVTIDIFHYAVHEGIGYVADANAALASSETVSLSFRTSTGTSNDVHLLYHARATLEANLKIIEDVTPTFSTGTTKAVYNRDRNSANTTSLSGHHGAAYSVGSVTLDGTVGTGTTIYEEHFGVTRSGGTQEASHEFVLKRNTTYCIKVTSEAAANDCELILTWFEVPVFTGFIT